MACSHRLYRIALMLSGKLKISRNTIKNNHLKKHISRYYKGLILNNDYLFDFFE